MTRVSVKQIAVFAITVLQVASFAWGEVTLFIRFVSYSAGGVNCDILGNPCDTYFIICLGRLDSGENTASCPYGKIRTRTFKNRNSVSLAVLNPMILNISGREAGVSLKVQVWDEDVRYDDRVDNFFKLIATKSTSILGNNRTNAEEVKETIYGTHNTRLTIIYSAYCTGNYFLQMESCLKYCKERDDEFGHFTCNSEGDKVCQPGITCSTDVDECLARSGQHGVCHSENTLNCTNTPGSYICICKPGFSGNTCQTIKTNRNQQPTTRDRASDMESKKNNRTWLIGLIVGLLTFFLIVGSISVLVFLVRKKQNRRVEVQGNETSSIQRQTGTNGTAASDAGSETANQDPSRHYEALCPEDSNQPYENLVLPDRTLNNTEYVNVNEYCEPL